MQQTAAGIAATHRSGGVVKFATRLSDGALIESVSIPMREREADGTKARRTLCLSTQVGCRMGCAFCATGRMGFVRNLAAEEILGQIETARSLGVAPDHLVFMGMGEPLDNYDNFETAVRSLVFPGRGKHGQAFSAARMIVSTCGLVPGLDRLATIGLRKLVLAVSINAPNDEIRSRLMPVNRAYPMAALRECLLRYPLRQGIFLAEYVLFRGVNDARDHARELAAYLKPFRACVNVIAYNRHSPEDPFRSPSTAAAERFRRWLNDEGQYARRRESKGRRIAAACGQLATQAAASPTA